MNPQDDYVDVPVGYGVPQMPRSDKADLLDKIKPEIVVDIIRHRLIGEDLVDGNWTPIPSAKKRALSPLGAWEISNLMLGTASVNVSISKLSDYEIKRRVCSICRTAIVMCVTNWKSYGIKDSSQLWFVREIVFTNALVVLRQADEGSIQELLKTTIQESRLVQSQPKPPSKIKRTLQGFFG